MRTRFLLVMLASAAIAAFTWGCSQSEEQTETMTEQVEVTCSGAQGDGTCAVTCSGDKESSECVITCEHADGSTGECTIMCDREGDEMVCTATCSGGQEVTITCDGNTIVCEHADGSKCTFEHPMVEGGCKMMKVADESEKSVEAGCAGCPGSKVGGCPASAAKASDAS